LKEEDNPSKIEWSKKKKFLVAAATILGLVAIGFGIYKYGVYYYHNHVVESSYSHLGSYSPEVGGYEETIETRRYMDGRIEEIKSRKDFPPRPRSTVTIEPVGDDEEPDSEKRGYGDVD